MKSDFDFNKRDLSKDSIFLLKEKEELTARGRIAWEAAVKWLIWVKENRIHEGWKEYVGRNAGRNGGEGERCWNAIAKQRKWNNTNERGTITVHYRIIKVEECEQ